MPGGRIIRPVFFPEKTEVVGKRGSNRREGRSWWKEVGIANIFALRGERRRH